jgi:hypothetical protein
MSSLKDALLKVGLKSSKKENDRQKRGKWMEVKKSVVHQEQRNYCEVCESIQPDVERYKHRNPVVVGEWICVSCADKNMIDDKFRVSAQSDFSIKKIFRREFGQTLSELSSKPVKSSKNINGNKSSSYRDNKSYGNGRGNGSPNKSPGKKQYSKRK